MKKEELMNNNSGLASVILAIVSLACSFGLFPLGFGAGLILAIVALIFGIIQNKKYKNSWSRWGIILSVISIIINILILIWFVAVIMQFLQQYQQLAQIGAFDQLNQANLNYAQQ